MTLTLIKDRCIFQNAYGLWSACKFVYVCICFSYNVFTGVSLKNKIFWFSIWICYKFSKIGITFTLCNNRNFKNPRASVWFFSHSLNGVQFYFILTFSIKQIKMNFKTFKYFYLGKVLKKTTWYVSYTCITQLRKLINCLGIEIYISDQTQHNRE